MSSGVPAGGPANGNGKILWWLIGLLTTGVVGVTTGTVHTVQDGASRIAVLESRHQEIQRRLLRIEEKLDQVLTKERSDGRGRNRPD